jgi:ribosomal protein S18 acetylase RimI-like enzyme
MAISPALRGRGIGRKLLEFTIEQAKQMGAGQLSLGSSTKLANAVHLYESLGFRHVPRERLPWMEYARSDVFMELPLSTRAMESRLAVRADIPRLLGILGQVVPLMRTAGNLQWDEIYPNAGVLEDDIIRGQLWVAVIEGCIAGMAAITMDQSPEYAEAGWDIDEPAIVVHRLAVDPNSRGLGVAQLLMRKAEVVARERGICKLRVDTNTRNEATQRLFPKLGYLLAGEIGLGFRPGLRFYCYEKCLG